MKILHVITSLSPKQGGTTSAVQAMAQAVAQQGATLHVATTDDNGSEGHLPVALEQAIEEDGVIYWYFRRQTRFYGFSQPLTAWLANHVQDYDLVHAHGLFIYSSLPAAYYARRFAVPYVVSPHGILNQWGLQNRRAVIKKGMLHFLEKPVVLNHVSALHFTCQQEQIEAAVVGVTQPAFVVPLGIPVKPFCEMPSATHFFQRYPQARDHKLLLFLSRIDAKKGLDLLLPAFANIQREHPQTALVIAGEGKPEFVEKLQALARELRIEHKIIWTGFITGIDKLSALAAADLFVLPSYSENFGIAVVEAMAAGLPTIVSDQVGLYRELQQAAAGLVVSCTVEDVAHSLKQLLADGGLREQMGKNGRQLAYEQFSLESMGRGLVQMYRQILLQRNTIVNRAQVR